MCYFFRRCSKSAMRKSNCYLKSQKNSQCHKKWVFVPQKRIRGKRKHSKNSSQSTLLPFESKNILIYDCRHCRTIAFTLWALFALTFFSEWIMAHADYLSSSLLSRQNFSNIFFSESIIVTLYSVGTNKKERIDHS